MKQRKEKDTEDIGYDEMKQMRNIMARRSVSSRSNHIQLLEQNSICAAYSTFNWRQCQIQLEIVFTIAAPAFDVLFIGCVLNNKDCVYNC